MIPSLQCTAGVLWFSLELFSIDTTSPFSWIPGKRNNLNHQTKKKVKGFRSFTLNAYTGLKELDLLLSTVCRTPHFDSWRTGIQNARQWLIMNIVAQSSIEGGGEVREPSLVYNPQLFIMKQSPIKIFYLGTNFALFLTREGSWSHSVFFALLQVCWCCHRAGDTCCLKNLFVIDVLNYVQTTVWKV